MPYLSIHIRNIIPFYIRMVSVLLIFYKQGEAPANWIMIVYYSVNKNSIIGRIFDKDQLINQ